MTKKKAAISKPEPKKMAGRRLGGRNRRTLETMAGVEKAIQATLDRGVLPLEIMMAVARGGVASLLITDRQLNAAIAAAPYVHPRLSAVAIKEVPVSSEADVIRAATRAAMIKALQAFAVPEPLTLEGSAEGDPVEFAPLAPPKFG